MFHTYRSAKAYQEQLLRDARPGHSLRPAKNLPDTLTAVIPSKVWRQLGPIEKQVPLEPAARLSQETP